MSRSIGVVVSLVVGALLVAGGALGSKVIAQEATPTASGELITIVLVEHNEHDTNVDVGEPGPSAGDLRVWGPNPLFDADNATDSGATTQGSCVALNAASDCLAQETVVFADGSTLEIQGVQLGGGQPSMRTIVAGSGQFLGAVGTVSVAPTEDEAVWSKTFEFSLR
jgi:hypothetical protein